VIVTTSNTLRTELRCMAPHPLKDKYPERFGRRTCNALITPVPAFARWTGRVLKAEINVTPGMIPARCWKCGQYSEYEVVAPDQVAA
jgi:hypothetical protein